MQFFAESMAGPIVLIALALLLLRHALPTPMAPTYDVDSVWNGGRGPDEASPAEH